MHSPDEALVERRNHRLPAEEAAGQTLHRHPSAEEAAGQTLLAVRPDIHPTHSEADQIRAREAEGQIPAEQAAARAAEADKAVGGKGNLHVIFSRLCFTTISWPAGELCSLPWK